MRCGRWGEEARKRKLGLQPRSRYHEKSLNPITTTHLFSNQANAARERTSMESVTHPEFPYFLETRANTPRGNSCMAAAAAPPTQSKEEGHAPQRGLYRRFAGATAQLLCRNLRRSLEQWPVARTAVPEADHSMLRKKAVPMMLCLHTAPWVPNLPAQWAVTACDEQFAPCSAAGSSRQRPWAKPSVLHEVWFPCSAAGIACATASSQISPITWLLRA